MEFEIKQLVNNPGSGYQIDFYLKSGEILVQLFHTRDIQNWYESIPRNLEGSEVTLVLFFNRSKDPKKKLRDRFWQSEIASKFYQASGGRFDKHCYPFAADESTEVIQRVVHQVVSQVYELSQSYHFELRVY